MTRHSLLLATIGSCALLVGAVPASAQNLLLKFGSLGSGDGQFNSPAGIAAGLDGRIVVLDSQNNRVQVFDSQGRFIFKFGSAGQRSGQFLDPSSVAVDRDGHIYVADTRNGRIQKFDASGTFLLAVGARGSGDGQFGSLFGVAVDSLGRIIASDGALSRIQVFSRSGQFLFKFGSQGSGDGQFSSLAGVTTDVNGRIYAADNGNDRVQIFDRAGQFVSAFGSRGSEDGRFFGPTNVAVDRFGIIYVADSGNARIQKFDRDGDVFLKYGPTTGPDALRNPLGITADPAGNVWVTDFENHYVAKLDMLRNFLFSITLVGPHSVAVHPLSGDLFVTHPYINRYDADGRFIEQIRRDREYSFIALQAPTHDFVLSPAPGTRRVFAYARFLSGLFEEIYSMDLTSSVGGVSADLDFVYVADPGAHSVNVFTNANPPEYLRTVTYQGERPFDPVGIKGVKGAVYAVDYANRRVVKFDERGQVALQVGTRGTGAGQFESPQEVDVDGLGGIYVTDNALQNVQKFDGNGHLLYQLGGEGSFAYNLHSPAGIAVSKTGRIYVADFLGPRPNPSTGGRLVAFADDLKRDADEDGLHGTYDLDQDGDGLADENEGEADTDADGFADRHDLDADADGICDVLEAGLSDANGDCRYDDTADDNHNGLADTLDADAGGVPPVLPDTDDDGTPDFRDGDSDNDGTCDVSEIQGGIDTNRDCVYDNEEDLDEDGLADALYFIGGKPSTLKDSDRDGVFDHLDADSGAGNADEDDGCSLVPHRPATSARLLLLLVFPAVMALRRLVRRSGQRSEMPRGMSRFS